MTDYSDYKIPVVEGVNDIAVAPNEDNSGSGCNGAYYIEKYNAFLDTFTSINGISNGTSVLEIPLVDGRLELTINNIPCGFVECETGIGNGNIVFGEGAGSSLTTGKQSVFLGVKAGANSLDVWSNVFIGSYSGEFNTSGEYNTYVGFDAGRENTTGDYNSAYGFCAGQYNTTGSYNSFYGFDAGRYNTTGEYNTYIGFETGGNSGSYNTALGFIAGVNNEQGGYNTFLGYTSGIGTWANDTVTASYCVAVGASAGFFDESVDTALAAATDNTGNICIGANSVPSSITSVNEITLGGARVTAFRIPGVNFTLNKATMEAATNGQAIVYDSTLDIWKPGTVSGGGGGTPTQIVNGTTNFSISSSGGNITYTIAGVNMGFISRYNLAIGSSNLNLLTTGIDNVALGREAIRDVTSGSNNVGIGEAAMTGITTGNYNVAIGNYAAFEVVSGVGNTAIGANALSNIYNTSFHTALGRNAGSSLNGGTNNTIIGYNAQASSGSVSNQVTLGNSSITSLRCAVTSITSLSDARDKKNIRSLSAGLDFVANYLTPVRFTWDTRDGAKVDIEDYGFIAQDLQEAQEVTSNEWLGLVSDNNPDRLEASTGKLIPVLVKAIQELNDKVENLTQQLEAYQNA